MFQCIATLKVSSESMKLTNTVYAKFMKEAEVVILFMSAAGVLFTSDPVTNKNMFCIQLYIRFLHEHILTLLKGQPIRT